MPAAEVVTFYHTDPVGTPLAMTDANGQKVWEADYNPFGEEYTIDAIQENNRRFVGKEKDAETGLDYFGACYMAVEAGRFLAPDPVRAVDGFTGQINASLLNNPQRLNIYAYSLNNPYKYVDSDGRAVWGVNLGFGGTWFNTKFSIGGAFLLDSKGNFAFVPNIDVGGGIGNAVGVFVNGVAGLENTTVNDFEGISSSVSGSVSLKGRKGLTFALTKPSADKTFVELGHSPLSFGDAEGGLTVGYGKIKYKVNISEKVCGNLGEKVYDFFHSDNK